MGDFRFSLSLSTALLAATAILHTLDAGSAFGSQPRSNGRDAGTRAPTCRDRPDDLERSNANVRARFVAVENGIRVDAENLRPIAAELLLTDLNSGGPASRSIILPALSTTTVMQLEGTDVAGAREKLRTGWRLKSYFGDPSKIVPDTGYRYRLPFREGKTYKLVQGFEGMLSHGSEASRYALDFQLEVGEPVHAARGGLVIRAVDWFCRAGGRELIDQVNMIVVAHNDGTMAHYVHLDHNGVLVREGDRIERGQQIGTVGMTGFTGGPHLHFVVMRERDVSIPIKFEGYVESDLSKAGRFRVP